MRRVIYDSWTGKPVDKLSDLLPASAGFACDECGAEVISRCIRCGAPVCCPRCCFEANDEASRLALEPNDGR